MPVFTRATDWFRSSVVITFVLGVAVAGFADIVLKAVTLGFYNLMNKTGAVAFVHVVTAIEDLGLTWFPM